MTYWQDVLLSRRVDDGTLVRAFGDVLGVPRAGVRVIETVEDLPPLSEAGVGLVLDRVSLGGDFPLQVSIYVRDPGAAGRVTSPDADVGLIRDVCRILDCDALVSDDSPSVLTSLRVRSSGEVDAVTLDPDRLEHDEYVIATARPVDSRAVRVP